MSPDERRAFKAAADAWEQCRDKPQTRAERSAALGALATFVSLMGWEKAMQDELEQRARRR